MPPTGRQDLHACAFLVKQQHAAARSHARHSAMQDQLRPGASNRQLVAAAGLQHAGGQQHDARAAAAAQRVHPQPGPTVDSHHNQRHAGPRAQRLDSHSAPRDPAGPGLSTDVCRPGWVASSLFVCQQQRNTCVLVCVCYVWVDVGLQALSGQQAVGVALTCQTLNMTNVTHTTSLLSAAQVWWSTS